MQLTITQRKNVFSNLHAAYNENDLRLMLWMELGRQLDDLVARGQELPMILMELISKAEGGGWLPDLLKATAAHKEENNELNLFVQEFLAGLAPEDQPGADPDPFTACFLRRGDRMPFVDRHDLRGYLKGLADPDSAYLTLVVDGERSSGKTYTQQFITFLADRLNSLKYVYIDLGEVYTPEYQPGDLMESIALQMNADPRTIPHQEASVDRWNQLLCQWLIGQSNKSPYDWWIVIDSLSRISLRKDTEGLIHRMVKDAYLTRPHLRVVLLDCGGLQKLPVGAEDYVAYSQLSTLTRVEVEDFFRKLWTQRGLLFEDSGLQAATEGVMQLAGAGGTEPAMFMKTLARAIVQVHQKSAEPAR